MGSHPILSQECVDYKKVANLSTRFNLLFCRRNKSLAISILKKPDPIKFPDIQSIIQSQAPGFQTISGKTLIFWKLVAFNQ